MEAQKKQLLRTAGLPALVVLVLIAGYVWLNASASKAPPLIAKVDISPAKKIEIEGLVSHENTVLSEKDLRNKWSFVFFGYTNCPDVCPATLSQLVLMKKSLTRSGQANLNQQFIFVSVDPERDTINQLSDYIRFFDADFVAATGSKTAIDSIEKQFGVFHRFDKKNPSGFYTVQHSAEVFLINPNGELTAKFTPPMDIRLVVEQIGMIVERYQNAAA